jgi:hypothetical protein
VQGALRNGTVVGAPMPLLAEWLGRKATLGIFFALMTTAIWIAFGRVFYMGAGALGWFGVLLPAGLRRHELHRVFLLAA